VRAVPEEARLVAMMNHENIATVLDLDVASGLHDLAIEFVHGPPREILVACSRSRPCCRTMR
jgi:hypothetical protein